MFESSVSRIRGSLGNAECDPELDPLRDDPRFQKILADAKKRLGIGGGAVIAPAMRTAS